MPDIIQEDKALKIKKFNQIKEIKNENGKEGID